MVAPDFAAVDRVRGMRDLLPDEMLRRRHIEDTFRQVTASWGYREVRTPTIEHLHLFSGAGTLSPQMLRRVYSFLDWDGWSGERVVLRPDATIPVARLYAEHFAAGEDARLAYVQNVFRFASGDESREDWQCGVERIGARGPQADLELTLLGMAMLRRLGAPDPHVRLSHTGVVRAVLARAGLSPDEQLAHYDRILEGDLGGLAEVEARLPDLPAPLRLLFETDGDRAFVANLRAVFAGRIPEIAGAVDELATVVDALSALGEPYTVSMALARSFEYYTGVVFRFDAGGRRVGGGGRYDGLLRLVGGHDVPASGFALEVEEIASLLPTAPETARPLVVRPAAPDTASVVEAHRVGEALREGGRVVTVGDGVAAGTEILVQPGGALQLRDGGHIAIYDTLADLVRALSEGRGS